MARGSDVHIAQPSEIIGFLEGKLPFSDLGEEELAKLAKKCTIDFYPKGTRIFTQGETKVDSLFLIQRGGVKYYLSQENGEEKLVDYRGEGDSFGALAIIRDGPANLNVDTIEDSFFFKLPKEALMGLIDSHPSIAQYYLKTLSDRYVSKAFSELRKQQISLGTDSSLYLFSTKIGDTVKRVPEMIPSGGSIRRAATLMVQHGIGSLLVTDPYGEAVGIVTDKDLRRAVSEGEDYNAPIEFIMSSPVATINHHDLCFDALLKMMAAQIHHLAVKRQGKIVGIITSHDIMLLQGRSPIYLFRDIVAQRSIQGLYDLSHKVPKVVGALIEEGAKAGNITRMTTVLNDLILERLLIMLQEEMGPPPVPFCWLCMGSEGRKEQTFRTDQDNALVYKDPVDKAQALKAEEYFASFTKQVIGHLVACGYPLCPGDMMASNPRWRQPFALWRDYFERLISVSEPEEVLHATIFFDFRPGFGYLEMGESLRNHVTLHARRHDVFLRYLAKDCLTVRPPLSFFKNFIVEKNGEHKNTLDLKKRSLVPFVDFARLFALKHGIKETNTLDRLHLLGEGGHVPLDLIQDTCQAYEFLMQVRLVHQMGMINRGAEPDNHMDPARLSDLEKRTLKEAFGVISRIQAYIRDEFRLNQG